ncbi:MAG TPA: PfkB family carbohydrate kinase [Pyrinomonadaceae bacterium]
MHFPIKLKESTKVDVTGFGTNAVDFLIRVPHYPEFNSKVELIDYVQAAGGEVATTLVGLERLGLRCAYVGRFGSDPAGELGIASLRDEGVDLTYAETIEGGHTQIAFIVIDERNGERTVIWKRDEKLHYAEHDVPLAAVHDTKVLHLTPHDTRASIRLAEEARKCGAAVSIDIDNVFEGVEHLLGLVNIVVASSDFPMTLLGISDVREALLEMQDRFGAEIVGITLGENGSLLLCGGRFVETPGFAVPGGCKDTTGAGDSFRAGLLYGLISGRSVEESAMVANAVAALKCRAVGARTALPQRPEVEALLKKV